MAKRDSIGLVAPGLRLGRGFAGLGQVELRATLSDPRMVPSIVASSKAENPRGPITTAHVAVMNGTGNRPRPLPPTHGDRTLVRHWEVERTARGIVITCRGHDKDGQADRAVARFDELLRTEPGTVLVVADMREMTGYESRSRQAWQLAFRAHRSQVRQFVIVGARTKLVRMGAAVIGAFAGVPICFLDEWSDLEKRDLTA